MATTMNRDIQEKKSTVGFLLIIGEIISNEQRDEICVHLKQAFKKVNSNKYREIIDIFNNLIYENDFHADSQFRQIVDTENGSVAGFIYLPTYHTVLHIVKDLFNTCYNVCIIYCGQQVDSNGALVLSDSLFTSDNFYSLFNDNVSHVIQDLELILPFVSNQWKILATNKLNKKLQHIQISDLSEEIEEDNIFGELFYGRFVEVLNKNSINFDIYSKLIPRDSAGTIAFDEPNLYVFYGQQGEASLFGVRGFVVLVNGGFSRIPSYWNFIRGLQNIDACILTHYDYDTLPGLQTVLHRKVISSFNENESCKPDIGTIFLNHIQHKKLQAINPSTKSLTSNSLINLPETIDQFSRDIKQLNIDTFDLSQHSTVSKQHIQPINLFKKIAFGSLDLYVLHPVGSNSEYEKTLANLQKIPIGDQEPSPSKVPLHHWYSSCLLLVWTPTSKSSKDTLVRILYTGACPQTLVFEALSRARHLEFLNASEQQQQKVQKSNMKRTSSPNKSTSIKSSTQKVTKSPPVTNRVVPTTVQNKIPKTLLPSMTSKSKIPQTKTGKSEKSQSATLAKKTPPPTTHVRAQSNNRDKTTQKSLGTTYKVSPMQSQIKHQLKTHEVQHDHQEKVRFENDYQEPSDSQTQDQEVLDVHNEHQEFSDMQHEEQQTLENQFDHQLVSPIQNEDQDLSEHKIEHQQELEIQNDELDQSYEIQNNAVFQKYNEDQSHEENNYEILAEVSDENNPTLIDDHESETQRPEAIPLVANIDESFVESHTGTPNVEIHSESILDDPMTTGFIEGTPNKKNPFVDEENDNNTSRINNNNNDDDDLLEIIQHDISSTDRHSVSSTEEINPQGLPVENNIQSIKPIVKRLSHTTNRTNEKSKSTSNITQISSSKSKLASVSGSIYNVDVAYIPFHGNESYVDKEFFRRVRARYYILNAVQINRLTLESLLQGKELWENKEHLPVSLVPTFDGEPLRQFFITNKTRLAELNINILPASIRCNVQYDDEASPAQILRFSSINNSDEQ